jgi:phosphate starvation-inducible PhoH-like protein
MSENVPLHSLEEERTLLGPRDVHARAIRNRFGVSLVVRDGRLYIDGEAEAVADATAVVRSLLDLIRDSNSEGEDLDETIVAELIEDGTGAGRVENAEDVGPLSLPPGVRLQSKGQERFVHSIEKHTVTFAIGPAGTGKTYLAAAVAVTALRQGQFNKLVLCRPAVEAGEHLGFLPGDLEAKINPYLRPLYDALSSHLERGKLRAYLDSEVIEIAPLAYMRGRTLDNAFIILDEAQNTTVGQMRMFLTRMGGHSKVVVTGDDSQSDLPPSQFSGLRHAELLLRNVPGIGVVRLGPRDIVRHPLVQKIVNAYQSDEHSRDSSGPRRR